MLILAFDAMTFSKTTNSHDSVLELGAFQSHRTYNADARFEMQNAPLNPYRVNMLDSSWGYFNEVSATICSPRTWHTWATMIVEILNLS